MKVIKLLSSGLVLDEDFDNSTLPEILISHANITNGVSSMSMEGYRLMPLLLMI
jgi:hypothetical protein